MIEFSESEKRIVESIKEYKRQSGSHSPSNLTLLRYIPDLKINIDACFLSNPYATDLFLKYFEEEVVKEDRFRDLIEFYPSQNNVIAKPLAAHLNIPPENLFIGNGAIEIIQAILHQFVKGSILLSIPTFSSYYEFVKPDVEVLYNKLSKENNFKFNVEDFIKTAKEKKVNSVIIINPNNPDGGYISQKDIISICDSLKDIDNIIVDESFIHFAFENDQYYIMSVAGLIEKYPNLVVIKSMSKDFGIAGLRVGYGVMSKEKVAKLLRHGFLWNSSGLAEYFFYLYARKDFNDAYEKVRKEYIQITNDFLKSLEQVKNIKVYPGKANFALIELLTNISSEDASLKLLTGYGINVRDCSDKIGLNGQFIRVASRKVDENQTILSAFKEIFNSR